MLNPVYPLVNAVARQIRNLKVDGIGGQRYRLRVHYAASVRALAFNGSIQEPATAF